MGEQQDKGRLLQGRAAKTWGTQGGFRCQEPLVEVDREGDGPEEQVGSLLPRALHSRDISVLGTDRGQGTHSK